MADGTIVEIDVLKDYPQGLPLNSAVFETWCIGKLKAAGIPIKGVLIFRGLTHGVLTRDVSYEHPNIIRFKWSDKDATQEQEKRKEE